MRAANSASTAATCRVLDALFGSWFLVFSVCVFGLVSARFSLGSGFFLNPDFFNFLSKKSWVKPINMASSFDDLGVRNRMVKTVHDLNARFKR